LPNFAYTDVMPASIKKKSINLLPTENNVNSFSSRFIKWLTTTGRVVIIFTELIVVGAFLSRFYFDRQNSDISEVIKQQKSIMDSVKDFEKQFTDTQKRIASIKDIKTQVPNFDVYLKAVVSHVPTDIIINQFRMTAKPSATIVDLVIDAYQEPALVAFINNLSRDKTITSVKISRIEKKPKIGSYTVTIQLEFKYNKLADAKSSN